MAGIQLSKIRLHYALKRFHTPGGAVLAGKTEEEVNLMRIAVSSTGPELHDLVDPRFGRCRYYIFYDEGTGLHESKENTAGMH
jgi:hypothetical protein